MAVDGGGQIKVKPFEKQVNFSVKWSHLLCLSHHVITFACLTLSPICPSH